MIAADVLDRYRKLVEEAGLGEFELDQRPWGGEFVYDETQLGNFLAEFFPDDATIRAGAAKPKLLFIAPGQRFSWQYHERRSELWRVIEGPVGLHRSHDDAQGEVYIITTGDMVTIKPLERHRLSGVEGWGVVAEVWQHVDPAHPSDEADNVRLADDYGR